MPKLFTFCVQSQNLRALFKIHPMTHCLATSLNCARFQVLSRASLCSVHSTNSWTRIQRVSIHQDVRMVPQLIALPIQPFKLPKSDSNSETTTALNNLTTEEPTFRFFVRSWPPASHLDQSSSPKSLQKMNTSMKIRLWIDKWADKGVAKWEQLNMEDDSQIKKNQSRASSERFYQRWLRKGKHWVYENGNRFMDKVDADEWFLKDIPHGSLLNTVPSLIIYYPDATLATSSQKPTATLLHGQERERNEVQRAICRQLLSMAQEREILHKRWKRWSVFGIPFSIMAGIIPGPNVFLMYNLFRLYSHDKAWLGAQSLLSILRSTDVQSQPPPKLTESTPANTSIISFRPLSLLQYNSIKSETASSPSSDQFDLMRVESEDELHQLGDFLIRSPKLAPRFNPDLYKHRLPKDTPEEQGRRTRCSVELFVHSARRSIVQEWTRRNEILKDVKSGECIHQQGKW